MELGVCLGYRKLMFKTVSRLSIFLVIVLASVATRVAAADHAVALVYHHVSTTFPAATSVTPKQFEAHLDFLERNEFNVWPLGKILQALQKGETVPDNTVAITFDDASISVFTDVFPRLKVKGWPFTVFVNTEAVDRGFGNNMNWEQLRQIAESGNEIGNHSHAHGHMIRVLENESSAAWQQRIRDDIRQAQSLIEENTGTTPTLFAYPYGEHSADLRRLVNDLGLLGVAQQSGAIGQVSDFLAVPRFPIATRHASLSRLATAVRSRPLPVIAADLSAVEDYETAPDSLTLTLGDAPYRLSQLACYSSRGDKLEVGQLSASQTRIHINLRDQTQPGRNKVNCTAPASDESKAFFWYSHLWIQKRADGSWYQE